MRFTILAIALGAAGAFAQALPDGPGKDTVEAICTACHTTEKFEGKQWTRAQWKDKILEMLQEEPDVKEAERDQILEYLSRTFYKKVNVNKARASEMEAALEIEAKDAVAIVAYRDSKGAFKSVDDVKKVPGVNAAKVEASKQRIEF